MSRRAFVLLLLGVRSLHAQTTSASEPDLVEQIDDTPEAPTARPPADNGARPVPAAPREPVQNERFQISGWFLLRNELALRRVPDPGDGTRVPHDAAQGGAQLFTRARYARGRSFELDVSGLFSYTLLEREPGGQLARVRPFERSARGEGVARLHELYVGLYGTSLDLRLGQQRVAWGNSEFVAINDVVNARDLRDPFVGETELLRQPTPVARLSAELSALTAELALAPYYVPDAFDVYGSNWAALQPAAPRGLRGLFGLLYGAVDPTLGPDLTRLSAQTELPARNLSAPVPSLRTSFHLPGWDFSQCYQYGFDGPFVTVDPNIASALASTDFTRAGLASLSPVLASVDQGAHPLSATYRRRHHLGFDAAVPIGSFVLRGEGAYESRKVYYTPELVSYAAPTVHGTLGLEYHTGDPAKLALVEAYGLRVLRPAPELLVYDRTTFGVGALVRWPIYAGFGVEPRVLVGFRPRSAVLEPQITWKRDSLTLLLGALVLDGDERSFGAYYRYNSELFLKLRVLL